MADRHGRDDWYCVRTVLQFSRRRGSTYEERLTLWMAPSFDTAVEEAESEAREYADSMPGCVFIGLAQAYRLSENPGHGVEVFSLMRDSALGPDAYLTTFFDTGTERQAGISGT